MKETVTLYPFLLHAFFMSIFASVIGPFGGFFASGFKRAFKIKVEIRAEIVSTKDIVPNLFQISS
jgi:hypothetical protein